MPKVFFERSYGDSMIVAAAEKANCEFVFSEDLNPGQTFRVVVAFNPSTKEDEMVL